MNNLLLVLMLVALSASLGAADEFRKVEDGVYVLGAHEEPGVPLNSEGKGWHRYTVHPQEGDGEQVITLWPGGPRTVKSDSRYNLIQGNIGLWDVMLAHYQPQRTAVPNTVILQDIPYFGNANVLISFIRVVQTSGQDATPTILDGGIGRTYVTIRLTSPRGQGFQFSIDIWGR